MSDEKPFDFRAEIARIADDFYADRASVAILALEEMRQALRAALERVPDSEVRAETVPLAWRFKKTWEPEVAWQVSATPLTEYQIDTGDYDVVPLYSTTPAQTVQSEAVSESWINGVAVELWKTADVSGFDDFRLAVSGFLRTTAPQPAQTQRALTDEQRAAIEKGVGLLWGMGKHSDAKELRSLLADRGSEQS